MPWGVCMAERKCRGVHSYADLVDRCRINDETGCVEWGGAIDRGVCKVNVPGLGVTTAQRAGWLLAGRGIAPGGVVWRKHCGNRLCVLPEHGSTGTRQQMRRDCGRSGREKGSPVRAARLRKLGAANAVPVEVVREIERMLAGGAKRADVVAAAGVDPSTVTKIRQGRHIHSAGRAVLLPMASVFAWAGAQR
jgi:hypothetical protein